MGGLSIGNHVTGKRVHAKEEQEISCFEGNRGRKLRGKETREEEERKKADGRRDEVRKQHYSLL